MYHSIVFSISAPGDYKELTNQTLTFSSERISHVISVSIVEDDVSEEDEQLFFMLLEEYSDVKIELTPSVAILTIVDDDRKEGHII